MKVKDLLLILGRFIYNICVCLCNGKYISGTQNEKRKREKNRNLLNSKMEKGKIWNGKSVPLRMWI